MAETRHDERVSAHIFRLFLNPYNFARLRVSVNGSFDFGLGPGIELFNQDDRNV